MYVSSAKQFPKVSQLYVIGRLTNYNVWEGKLIDSAGFRNALTYCVANMPITKYFHKLMRSN